MLRNNASSVLEQLASMPQAFGNILSYVFAAIKSDTKLFLLMISK